MLDGLKKLNWNQWLLIGITALFLLACVVGYYYYNAYLESQASKPQILSKADLASTPTLKTKLYLSEREANELREEFAKLNARGAKPDKVIYVTAPTAEDATKLITKDIEIFSFNAIRCQHNENSNPYFINIHSGIDNPLDYILRDYRFGDC